MSEEVEKDAIDLAMSLAQEVIRHSYGGDAAVIMFVKAQNSVDTVMTTNLDRDMATKIVKGYVEHEEKRHEHH